MGKGGSGGQPQAGLIIGVMVGPAPNLPRGCYSHSNPWKLTPDCLSSLSPKVKAEILGNDYER